MVRLAQVIAGLVGAGELASPAVPCQPPSRLGGNITAEQREQTTVDLFALRGFDCGWAMASVGNWKRSDGQPQDLTTSDGYGIGFTTCVLRTEGGVPAEDSRLRKAVIWMKTHQHASGCWFTRSLRENDELDTYAVSVYVILALSAFVEIPLPAAGRD